MEDRVTHQPLGEGEPRKILLVDCDMFYVQVARLEDPEGAGREDLLIVGGSPSGRGVVTSASYQVRAYGVRSAMPTAQALRLCPRAVVVPVSRTACSARSRQVLAVLRRMAPVVQAASIDEFYLDLTGTERLLHHEALARTAQRIREEVLEDTGISVSVGGGTRKLIAKLAAGRAKPAGVLVVPPGREEAFMREFRLAEIPGVGPALAQALGERGLTTVDDILPVDRSWLEEWFGRNRGGWLWGRARGLDDSRVSPYEPRKSVSSEKTFSKDIHDQEALERALLRLVTGVGAALRKSGFRGRTVTVKVRDSDFRTRTGSHTLPAPIEADATLLQAARALLLDLRQRRKGGVRLLGVGVSSLVEADEAPQLELFQEDRTAESPRDRIVSRVVDGLKERFGEDAVFPGGILEDSDE
ncbi:MAG: DNA polymerase IV [Gemmatimonadota bacterium]